MSSSETIPDDGQTGLPQWVSRMSVPVWVCDPDGRIVFANEKASVLLGGGRRLEGHACHLSVGGVDESGRPFCGAACSLRMSASRGEAPDPVLMRVHGDEPDGRWVLTLPIVLEGASAEDLRIVHCAHDLNPFVRATEYLKRVATRSRLCLPSRNAALRSMTHREKEILDLLGSDENNFSIARRLYISPVTVRNHVQHILRKLEVHSVQEAVALSLLDEELEDVTRRGSSSGGSEEARPG